MVTKDLNKITIGLLITASRFSQELTRKELAEKLEISEGYLGHLENDRPVPISDVLYYKLNQAIGVVIPKKMLALHNQKASKYYSEYRKKKSVEL